MSNFQDNFEEAGALWPTKSGTGLSGKLKKDVEEGTLILVLPNKSDKPNHPTHKIYIPRDTTPKQDPLASVTPNTKDEDMPF